MRVRSINNKNAVALFLKDLICLKTVLQSVTTREHLSCFIFLIVCLIQHRRNRNLYVFR